MKIYTIHTENKNRKWIESQIGIYFAGYTIREVSGFWRGKRENALEIVVVDRFCAHRIKEIAREIKEHNNQEAVLITSVECEETLI